MPQVVRWMVLGLVGALAGLMGCSRQAEETYPSRDITYIVPFGPGGGTDLISRMLAEVSAPLLPQKIVIVNKPGASATLGPGEVMRATPDGYTIGLSNNQAAIFTPQVQKTAYQGPEDFQLIIKLSDLPCVLTVAANAPWKTLDEFLADARKRPGELRASVAGKLTMCDLVWQGRFGPAAKADISTVPFTGGAGEAATALLGGRVEASLGDIIAVIRHIQAGKMRALAVFQKQRHPLLPDTPSVVELGYPTPLPITYFVIGPKGLDKAALDKLVQTFGEAIKTEKFQQFARENGYVLDPLGPEALRKELEEQGAAFRQIIKDLKIATQ